MARQSVVSLHVGGVIVDTWDSYTVTIDMLTPGSPFTFTVWQSDTFGTTWSLLRAAAKCYTRVVLFVDDAIQLDGLLETVDTFVDIERGVGMNLSGRDLAGWAMDADADPTLRLKGQTLGAALTALFQPLGFELHIAEAASARDATLRTAPAPRRSVHRRRRTESASRARVVDFSHPRPGDKVWGLAETMCSRQSYMIWTAPDGEGACAVVVDRPDFAASPRFVFSRQSNGDGTFRGNTMSASENVSVRGVPTLVNVYCGTARGESVNARLRVSAANLIVDSPTVTRGFVGDVTELPRHVRSQTARTIEQARGEADRIITDTTSHLRTYEVTVQGHTQTAVGGGGTNFVYSVNTMAQVIDDALLNPQGSPLNEAMLITRVVLNGSKSAGQKSTLRLIPRDSIILNPSTNT